MQEQIYYDDEIDLRELAQTLLNGWKVILAFTLIAALTAFALSKWVLPRKYLATAYVSITEPMIEFSDTGDISITSSLPDTKSVAELATNQALLEKVTTTQEVLPYWDVETDSITGMVTATNVGKDQLRLEITDTSPERAALLANTWAEEVTKRINMLYGVDSIAKNIESQVTHAKEEYAEAQSALEEELSQSKLDILSAQLDATKADLSCVLSRRSAATRILEDLQILEESLERQPKDASLSLGDALSLTTLQQRASASQICASETQSPQLQIGNDALVGFTISSALETIAQMREALQTQEPLLETEQARLEAEIPALQRDLAQAKYQLDQRTQARDQSQELYTALLEQQSRITTILMTGNKVATVSATAIVPDEADSPKTMMNTALGLVLGGMLGVFWVFLAGWWRGSDEEDEK